MNICEQLKNDYAELRKEAALLNAMDKRKEKKAAMAKAKRCRDLLDKYAFLKIENVEVAVKCHQRMIKESRAGNPEFAMAIWKGLSKSERSDPSGRHRLFSRLVHTYKETNLYQKPERSIYLPIEEAMARVVPRFVYHEQNTAERYLSKPDYYGYNGYNDQWIAEITKELHVDGDEWIDLLGKCLQDDKYILKFVPLLSKDFLSEIGDLNEKENRLQLRHRLLEIGSHGIIYLQFSPGAEKGFAAFVKAGIKNDYHPDPVRRGEIWENNKPEMAEFSIDLKIHPDDYRKDVFPIHLFAGANFSYTIVKNEGEVVDYTSASEKFAEFVKLINIMKSYPGLKSLTVRLGDSQFIQPRWEVGK